MEQPQTIAALKETARRAKQEMDAELARIAEQNAQAQNRREHLVFKAILAQHPALARETSITLEHEPFRYSNEWRIIAKFELADHAPLYARFEITTDDKHADQIGFDEKLYCGADGFYFKPDATKFWRVDVFAYVKWDDLGDSCGAYAKFNAEYFAALSYALLAAEEHYTDPALIQKEIDDLTARHAETVPVAGAPEPAPTDLLLDALRAFITDTLNNAQT